MGRVPADPVHKPDSPATIGMSGASARAVGCGSSTGARGRELAMMRLQQGAVACTWRDNRRWCKGVGEAQGGGAGARAIGSGRGRGSRARRLASKRECEGARARWRVGPENGAAIGACAGEEGDGERRVLSKKKASGGEKMPSPIHRRGRKRGCWMGFFFEVFPNLPSQMDLPRLLELLLGQSQWGVSSHSYQN
jgi:hypothetical protein